MLRGAAVHNWIVNQLARREAEALIKGLSANVTPTRTPPAAAELFILPVENENTLPRTDEFTDEP